MGRNLVVCCDGTSNQYAWDKTNVVKLFYCLLNDPARQITYYHPGLGTMGPPGALTEFDSWWTTTLGLAIGYGLESDIRDAYAFLMKNYQVGDHVFLFGFSRGAYTARSLASVMKMYGLIRADNESLTAYAIRMMEEMNQRANKGNPQRVLQLADGFKETFSRECKPWFVGVWDTVNSVGLIGHPLKLPYTANNPDIEIGRHAIAIDERRAFFPPNLWRRTADVIEFGPNDMQQVWFPGSHSDVGGGYPEQQSGQSKFALEWMMVEARAKGLLFDNTRAKLVLGIPANPNFVAPSVALPAHNSLTLAWWPTEFIPKRHFNWKSGHEGLRMNRGRRRFIPEHALVHESAFLRGDEYMKRLPASAIKVPRTCF